MAKLNVVVTRCKASNFAIDKLCKVKKYLPTEEKFKFIEEYEELLKSHIDDYSHKSFIAFIFFNLMVVKKYTDIELDLTYKEFDELQENGLINKIVEFIGEDYTLLLRLIKMDDGKIQ